MFFGHFFLTEESSGKISITSVVDVISSFVSSARTGSADEKNESVNRGS